MSNTVDRNISLSGATRPRVVIAGGSGFIGRYLTRALVRRNFCVTLLTRGARPSSSAEVEFVQWDGRRAGDWSRCLSGAHAVINLCGERIAGPRWTERRKLRLRDSRIQPAAALVQAIRQLRNPPAQLIQASGVGYVGTGEHVADETTRPGSDYLAQLAVAWEAAVEGVAVPYTIARFGVVLATDGGALPQMLLPFRLFGGGPIGDGQQWLSWVHIDDAVGAVLHAMDRRLEGVLHVTTPNPVRNAEFAQTAGDVLARPSWLRIPRIAFELALGEQATLVCDGQRAMPKRLLESGYAFTYPELASALASLLRTGV